MNDEETLVERAPDPYVTVKLDGVLLVKEDHVLAKVIRRALDSLWERLGDRRVSVAISTLDPPPPLGEEPDDVKLLRASFEAAQGEPMEDAARRVVSKYINGRARIPTERDRVIEAAMLVCRPGPGWSIAEACAVLRSGDRS